MYKGNQKWDLDTELNGKGTDGGGTGVCRSEMGVRSILIKVVFFNPLVSFSRGPGPALDGSVARQALCRSRS